MIKKVFNTPIGNVICEIVSPIPSDLSIINKKYDNGTSEIFNLAGYNIELIEFKLKQPLYNGSFITDTQGWIWRIENTIETNETLKLSCKLHNFEKDTEFDIASGEHLEAIEAFNKTHCLHIGTEDGEVMNFRAEKNNYFPSRLQDSVGFSKSITKTKIEGFENQIPDLKIGEKLHLQFLAAYDDKKSDFGHGNTWLAVEVPMQKLEKWIGIN